MPQDDKIPRVFRSALRLIILAPAWVLVLSCGPLGDGEPVRPLVSHAHAAAAPEAPEEAPEAPLEAPRAGVAASRGVWIAATGDLLLHERVRRSARTYGGWDATLWGLRSAAHENDILHLNLESPLVDDVNPPHTGEPPVLGGSPAVAGALARAGVDVVSFGNNHALDQNGIGAHRTIAAAREAGLGITGVGATSEAAHSAHIVTRGDLRIAFVSAAQFVNRGAARDGPPVRVARVDEEASWYAALAAAREEADLVVAAVHWGGDYATGPTPRQRRWAAGMIEAGADMVLGTGPHVLHPIEWTSSPRGDALIAWSLGNVLSNQGNRWRLGHPPVPGAHIALTHIGTRDGVVLRVRARGRGRVRFDRVEAVPIFTLNDFIHVRRTRRPPEIHMVRLWDAPRDIVLDRHPAIARAIGQRIPLVPSPSR